VNEQIEQAAQIIGLPDNWTTVIGDERARVTKTLVKARAEWVLRWALDKLKDETATGKTARGTVALWTLLDWMLAVLPVSRSAPHLRDAAFPSILERAMTENFDQIQPASTPADVEMSDVSGSSETTNESTKPSKKRKRGAASTNGTSGQPLRPSELQRLFITVRTLVRSITGLGTTRSQGEDTVQAELMKIVLRTDSAQAASILKNWLIAVEKLLALAPSTPGDQRLTEILDLSLVVEIWELRTSTASDESGASADEFSAECLVPALTLLDTLKALRSVYPDPSVISSIDRATQAIEKVLARHLFAPARAAFLADTDKITESNSKYREATLLASNLDPLRAKLLQAAQIEDQGESVPAELAALSGASSQLLSLAIRISPSKTPRSKLAEKPWIEAVFIALVECAGCSLTKPPESATPQTAIDVLVHAITILRGHSVSIRSAILKDLFWYHSGIRYPIGKDKQVRWSLVAALIELDPSVFVAEPKGLTGPSKGQQSDLTQVVFDELSRAQFEGPGFIENLTQQPIPKVQQKSQITRSTILERVIVPLMAGFATNRNLLGFINRWDEQLIKANRHENRKALKECKDMIWEDRTISQALAQRLELSLTQGQIAKLLQEHVQRMHELGSALSTESKQDVNVKKLSSYKRAASTSVIVPAVLQSIKSDDIIEAVKSQLGSLVKAYSAWVQEDRYVSHTRLSLSWLTLCQLVSKLWPIELHGSVEQQDELLSPLIEQSLNDVSAASSKRVDSAVRAAAMLFLLDACDHMQTLPGSEDLIRPTLDKVLQILSGNALDRTEHGKMVGFFCANFISLFGHLGAETSQRALQQLLAAVSSLDDDASIAAVQSLSQMIFEQGTAPLQDLYITTLRELLLKDDIRARNLTTTALYFVRPSAISREKREAVLDQLTDMIVLGTQEVTAVLSIVVQLMESSNATAKISSDGAILFQIAEQLQKTDATSTANLQLLQELAQLTLGQIVSNQSQSQNMIYLGMFKKKLDSTTSKGNQCSAANLAILRAVFAVQKQNNLLQPKQYVSVLKTCLTSESSEANAPSLEQVIDAFNELSTILLAEAKLLDSTQAWLRTWISENADLESYMVTGGQGSLELADYVARLHTTVAKYKLYSSTQWLASFTLKCLREPVLEQRNITTMATMKAVFAQLPIFEKLDLIYILTHPADPADQPSSYRLLAALLSTFEDRLESNIELRNNQLALLPKLCALLSASSDHASFNALISSINTLLSSAPSLATQHNTETVVAALSTLSSRSSPHLPAAHASAIYARLCATTRLILLLHRGRLGGRFHLLLPLLQNLLFLLFRPHSGRGALPFWQREPSAHLTAENAGQFARVLATLCNPPQSSIQKTHQTGKKGTLNDPVKKAREVSSAFLYPLLASYSRFQLSGRMEPSVREKVMPGIWEVVGTASLSRDGLDAMFAGLGRSERDVWRGVWSEWENVHGRKDLLSGDVV
jgi:nucleolar pre-ribosomal-associated protein 2